MGADTNRTVDLGESLRRAVNAARRGDVDLLERELSRLRRLGSTGAGSVATTLRQMARSARSHPSFRPATEPTAQAG